MIAIDPGCTHSAYVILRDGLPTVHAKVANENLLALVRRGWQINGALAIEMVASYGMAVGREVFETVLWIGKFSEAWENRGGKVRLVYRRDVKIFHCADTRANDSNIRASLIDRYGPGKQKAVGLKASPGPLYGIKNDTWQALALAVYAEAA